MTLIIVFASHLDEILNSSPPSYPRYQLGFAVLLIVPLAVVAMSRGATHRKARPLAGFPMQ